MPQCEEVYYQEGKHQDAVLAQSDGDEGPLLTLQKGQW
jgi:hypothetical protein